LNVAATTRKSALAAPGSVALSALIASREHKPAWTPMVKMGDPALAEATRLVLRTSSLSRQQRKWPGCFTLSSFNFEPPAPRRTSHVAALLPPGPSCWHSIGERARARRLPQSIAWGTTFS